jgi:tripartite-type tricarboxylate transporter receptor subunit TctC
MGQPVVIANVGGASGTAGAREAKNAAPDGYTVYAVHDYIHLTFYAGISDVKYSASNRSAWARRRPRC